MSDACRRNIEQQDDQVRKNCYILSKIINSIKFCGEFELALQGHDETSESKNPGIFMGLVNSSAALDNILKEHLDTTMVLKGTSKEIQNDLLDCMYKLCQEAIIEKIAESNFIAVIADETTDICFM